MVYDMPLLIDFTCPQGAATNLYHTENMTDAGHGVDIELVQALVVGATHPIQACFFVMMGHDIHGTETFLGI